MPLPFLNPKKMSSMIMAVRKKGDVEVAPEIESGDGVDPDLKEAMIDLLRAMDAKSPVDMAHAFQAAMACGEMEENESEA